MQSQAIATDRRLRARMARESLGTHAIMSKPSRILVAEDDRDLSDGIAHVLRKARFSVRTAANGLDAKRLMNLEPFDVLLSEIRIPGMNGFDLARSAALQSRPPQVILTTAFPDEGLVKAAQASGAVHFLAKPFRLQGLARVVEQVALGEGIGFISKPTLLRLTRRAPQPGPSRLLKKPTPAGEGPPRTGGGT